MLVNTPEWSLRISWMVILPVVAATAGIFVFAVSAGVKAQRRRPATGAEGLLGEAGVVRAVLAPEGQVLVRGEIWRAVAADGTPVGEGERVRVVGIDGLTLRVTREAAG
jgi:membrane-bound serine protease (ClpP class)